MRTTTNFLSIAFEFVPSLNFLSEIVWAFVLISTNSLWTVTDQNVFEFRLLDKKSFRYGGTVPLLHPAGLYLVSQRCTTTSFLQSFRVSEPISNLIK